MPLRTYLVLALTLYARSDQQIVRFRVAEVTTHDDGDIYEPEPGEVEVYRCGTRAAAERRLAFLRGD